jgi:hypothetical protein
MMSIVACALGRVVAPLASLGRPLRLEENIHRSRNAPLARLATSVAAILVLPSMPRTPEPLPDNRPQQHIAR